jgi:hypothetical protein
LTATSYSKAYRKPLKISARKAKSPTASFFVSFVATTKEKVYIKEESH